MSWLVSHKFDKLGAKLADGHYSRRTVGSPQFMPPGDTLVLVTPEGDAVFGWWRPHPRSGLKAMNGLDGWTCSIFRNTGKTRSSDLVLAAESLLVAEKGQCGPSGLLTYVWDRKVQSSNPGYCFKMAGWAKPPSDLAKPRSADGKKSLLWKPFDLAGVQACGVAALHKAHSRDVDETMPGPMSERDAFKYAVRSSGATPSGSADKP